MNPPLDLPLFQTNVLTRPRMWCGSGGGGGVSPGGGGAGIASASVNFTNGDGKSNNNSTTTTGSKSKTSISVRETTRGAGKGLFVNAALPVGTVLGAYPGKLITMRVRFWFLHSCDVFSPSRGGCIRSARALLVRCHTLRSSVY